MASNAITALSISLANAAGIFAGSSVRGTSGLKVDDAIKWLHENAAADYTGQQGLCAKFVRLALEAGGVIVKPPIASAKDYGPTLVTKGFIQFDGSGLQKGDVIVLQPTSKSSPDGHIAMFDGSVWISDFRQRDMWAGPAFRDEKASHVFYRP